MRKPYKSKISDKNRKALRRKLSIRRKISGSADCPRVCAVKTNKNVGLVVVDDTQNKVLLSVHSYGKKGVPAAGKTKEGAKQVAVEASKRLKDLGVSKVVFDRNGAPYHGIVVALADGLRENGIQF